MPTERKKSLLNAASQVISNVRNPPYQVAEPNLPSHNFIFYIRRPDLLWKKMSTGSIRGHWPFPDDNKLPVEPPSSQ